MVKSECDGVVAPGWNESMDVKWTKRALINQCSSSWGVMEGIQVEVLTYVTYGVHTADKPVRHTHVAGARPLHSRVPLS